MIVTDVVEQLTLIRRNVEMNDPKHEATIAVSSLLWGCKQDLDKLSSHKFDVILCSEVVYLYSQVCKYYPVVLCAQYQSPL